MKKKIAVITALIIMTLAALAASPGASAASGCEHNSVTVPGYPATCTKDGKTDGEYCSLCGETLVESKVIPAAHKPVPGPMIEPSCIYDGMTPGSFCAVCGEVLQERRVIPAKGHIWDKGTVSREPSETEEGEMVYKCLSCGTQRTESIPKLHSKVMLGDANGDGSVSIADATAIQRVLAGYPVSYFSETAADVTGKGTDILDATYIQRYLAELQEDERIGSFIE